MGLQDQQPDYYTQDRQKRQDAVSKAAHFPPEAAGQQGEGQNHRKLRQLRGLEGQPAHPQPAAGAVGLDADDGHQHQQYQRQAQEMEGVAPVEAHGQPGGQQHGPHPQQGKDQLAQEVIGPVAAGDIAGVIVGPCKAGGQHHHHTHGQQDQGQSKKAGVHALPPDCRWHRKIGEAGAFITHLPTSPIISSFPYSVWTLQ